MIRSVFFVFLILSAGHLFAQPHADSLITGDFRNLRFEEFASQVEERTEYTFFYDAKAVDSLVVDQSFRRSTVESMLRRIFNNTDLHFAIDEVKNIYIVKGIEFETRLLNDFVATDEGAQDRFQTQDVDAGLRRKALLPVETREYDIGKKTSIITPGKAVLAGNIKSATNGEAIVGASVFVKDPLIGVSTDQFGYFALTLPKGKHDLNIRSSGMKSAIRKITLYSDGILNIELVEDVITLKEVLVESEKDKNIASDQMGTIRMDIKTMKKIPVAFGELDLFKALTMLPGVQTVGEGTSGLNVRGGATSQNLILLDDATIYNPAHLFGFFSAFNPDVIKDAELYKSSIPAELGGRLSSVLDVNSRQGNQKKFTGTGGIGPVTGRLTLEGPILKNKASFLVGARSTYSDWLLKKIPADALKNSQASFYDINARLDFEINDRNSLYFTGYLSKDKFRLSSDTSYSYQSTAATAKWKHSFGNKLYSVLSGGYSGYNYDISSSKNPLDAFKLSYSIQQTNLKLDFNYFPMPKHSVIMGGNMISYGLSPGTKHRTYPTIKDPDEIVPREKGLESAVYIGDHYEASARLSIYAGLRYSFFSYLGPHDVYVYSPGDRSEGAIVDTVSYRAGKSIANYNGPEYRFSVKYSLFEGSSVKLSYNRTRQYIQMLTNTTAISPTDTWKLSDRYIRPQVGDQVSLGFYQNFNSNSIETSVETYYKTMENTVDYKDAAKLLLNQHIETDIIPAQGKAYGIEFMLKKMNGKLNGWITYTYSRSLLKTKSYLSSETVNGGHYYPSNYDKPHAFNFVGNYKFSHRYSTSLTMTYSTGRPITVPIGKFYVDGTARTLYGPRNGDRIPDFFRIDASVNVEGNHKIKKLAHSSWTFGVYNLTARRNAYSIFYETQHGIVQGYKLSVLGTAIPTITYNFKF